MVCVDELYLRIYRGTGGALLYEAPNSSATLHDMPIVVDVDADGNAEILAVSNTIHGGSQNGIYVIGDANDTWVSTRQVWNQHTYHITNINDDGTIPTHEENSWEVHNTYRLNAQPGLDPHAAPDLTASYLRASGNELNANLTARIGNGGELFVVAGVPVAFYDDDPQNGGTLLGATVTTTRLEPGQFEDVSIVVPQATIADRDDLGRGGRRRHRPGGCERVGRSQTTSTTPESSSPPFRSPRTSPATTAPNSLPEAKS